MGFAIVLCGCFLWLLAGCLATVVAAFDEKGEFRRVPYVSVFALLLGWPIYLLIGGIVLLSEVIMLLCEAWAHRRR